MRDLLELLATWYDDVSGFLTTGTAQKPLTCSGAG